MATFTDAVQSIEKIVSTYLFAYKKSTEDYSLYVQHAANCFQDFNLYDGNTVQYEKVTIDPLKKWIDMPDDMVQFKELLTPIDGGWWSFSEKTQIVTTTTTVGAVEGRDSAQGEGVTIDQPRVTSYGAKGGWNKFRYNIDWATRRIYVDQTYDSIDYVVLMYVSSGIKSSGETLVPMFFAPVIDSYLLYVETFWIESLMKFQDVRFAKYWRERAKVRDLINSMTYDQWRDIFLSSMTQAPQR